MSLQPSQPSRYLFSLAVTVIIIIATGLSAFSSCRVKSEPGPGTIWDLRGKLVLLTDNLIGLPYRWGGTDIDGFDCSGLVVYVYDCFGIKLVRTARKQAGMDKRVSLSDARPGDVVVFKLNSRWHSGIYRGNNRFIHAPNSRTRVRLEVLSPYWNSRLRAVIDVIGRRGRDKTGRPRLGSFTSPA